MDSECKDVSAIQDEDVLRRMWQHTEDFGKKKEIRAHMYKLREARLKEFYTSGEVLKDVQRSNSSPGLREQHVEKNQKWIEGGVTHADSLADHSFLSLKSKEIRDSESPTRDVQFRNSKNRADIDGTWTVASKTTKSNDGKTIINSQLATTQGSRPVDGGNLSYAALNQQEASVYTDGDANNFTKAVGESSKTFAQEQLVSGDENNFRTSKTVSSSSSSKFVSHSSSTTGNINMDDSLTRGQLQIEDGKSGTTRIIHNQDSSKTGSQNVQESKSSSTVTKRIQTSSPKIETQTTRVTKVTHGSDLPEDLKNKLIDGNTKVITETKTLPDGSTVTTTRYETKGSKKWSSTSGSTQVVEQKSSSTHVTGGNENKTVITTATKKIDNYPDNAENIRITKTDNLDGGRIHVTKHQENVYQTKENTTKQNVKDVKVTQDNVNNQTVKVTKTITTNEDHLQPVANETHTTVQTTKTTVDKEQQVLHKIEPKEPKKPIEKPKTPVKETHPRPQEIELTKSCKPPAEEYKPSEPTEGQYSTTYRSEFTPKRISVDISPTHDAFVRSLRCKSPDSDRRQSTTSLRSSTSPEKTSYSSRKSPERRTSHPTRKSPERKPSYDKYTSEPTRKHNTSPSRPHDYSPDRVSKSPDRSYQHTTTDTVTKKTSNTKITTRKSPERPITSSPTRSVSPTKSGPSSPTKNNDVIITTKTTKVTKTSSPEKTSPVRGPSPSKTFNTDTITRKKKPEDGNKISKPNNLSNTTTTTSETITRRTNKQTESSVVTDTRKSKRPASRDASPTTSVSDFEFVISTNQQMVTDLDEPEVKVKSPEKRPTSLEIDAITSKTTTTKKTEQNITKQSSSPVKESPRQKSPTKSSPAKSPTKDKSTPIKEVPKRTDFQPSAPELEPEEQPPSVFTIEEKIIATQIEPKEKPPLKRTETYEERCRKMLGLPEPEKPLTKEEIVPDEYAGRTPIEEPVFVKKHIDYGYPEDDIIKKTTDKIKSRKAEKKEPVDISEFITSERNIESDILPVEDTLPKVAEPKLFASPTRKSPEKQKPTGEYETSKPTPELKSPHKNIDDLPGYMRPIPKVTTEERDIMVLENRQRDTSPDKQPKTTPEYLDNKPIRKSPERSSTQHSEDRTFTTEYTDEYCEEKELTKKSSPVRKPTDKSDITLTSDKNYISKTYKQIESPVRAKSPTKKPNNKKPTDSDSSSSDDESIEVDEYYRTEVKTDIKTKDKKINRKSPSPVRRKPDLDRKSPVKDRESPSRGLPENVTVTEYINETELFETPRKTTTSEIDFISKEKHDTDINLEVTTNKLTEIEFDLENENIQVAHIRTHRIDETSPKRQPQKAIPSDTIECKIRKTPTKKEEDEKKPEERSKSPTKHIKEIKKDKTITKKTSSDFIETTKRRTTNEILKKKPSTDKSPERRSPSPGIKTSTKKVEETVRTVESTTRKCSKPIKNIPDSKPTKQISSKAPESPVRKPLYQSPERKPIKPSQPAETTKKHTVTKTISLSKFQPSSPIKETKPITLNKTPSKTFTTIKTTKVTHPATITVTKLTKTTAKTTKQNSKKVDTDSETELGVEDLRAEINSKTSRTDKKNVITTAKINVTSPKHPSSPQVKSKQHPNVTMPTIQRSTSSREPSPDKVWPVPVSSDDEYGHPRYPDKVSYPDDTPPKKKPQKITDIPLTEGEHVKDFNRITEVTETVTKKSPRITDRDKVTETDESLLSVTEKVSKFITTAEKLTEDEPKTKKPAPKVPRPELIVTEDLKEDECLLSVSDKVSKFINTAEQVSTTKKHDKPQSCLKPTTKDFKVEENDECLKSVNEKVNRFIDAAESSKQVRTSPKLERPEITDLDEDLRSDECLLSVSDKVSKFLTTADKLTTETSRTKTEMFISKERERSTEKTEIKRGKSPEKKPETTSLIHSPSRKSPERKICLEPSTRPKSEPAQTLKSSEAVKKADKVSKFLTTADKSTTETSRTKTELFISKEREQSPEKPEIKRGKSPEKKPETPSLIHSPSRKSPERKEIKICPEPSTRPKSEPVQTLKSSEAVKKAKAMFENISKTQEIPKQRDILSRPSVWEGRKKPEEKPVDDIKLTDIGVYKNPETNVRKQLNYNEKEDVTLKSTKLILNEKKFDRSSPERDTPTYYKPKTHERSKSPEEDEDVPGYMRPIPKVTTEERDQLIIESRLRESITPDRSVFRRTEEEEEEEVTEVFKSKPIENGDVPGYMRPLQRCLSPERDHKKSVREEEEIVVETTLPKRSYSPPEKDVPGYMKPLQRHVSPDRDTPDSSPVPDETPRSAKKFGVTLRRTDSGRMIPAERRRSSTPGQPVIEEITDLEVLEKMMDKVVGYEQRRRIRAQIRVVKRLISENKISVVRRPTRPISSPARDTTGSKSAPVDDRKSPAKKLRERSKSPSNKKTKTRQTCVSQAENEFSSFKSSSYVSQIETSRTSSKERSMSPDVKPAPTKVYKTDLKHVQPTKMSPRQPDTPSWVINRNLKKTTDSVNEKRNVTVIAKKKETPKRAYSPQKETKPTDCITSSYGIGPTDENGLPLFGIRALRKAADSVQVRGTVVTSEFYSENGNEPVGEVTVTKYSTDPKDLDINDAKKKGFTSVTTTQKFGTRGAPSLRTLTDKKKAITDKHSEQDEIIKTTSTKVTRRGSVKALSQKFIENAVETTTKEKQTGYPKAGLILRTSSFKDSSQPSTERSRVTKSSSRESSPGYESRPTKISLESITSDSRNFSSSTSTEQTQSTKTFLNSHTRVTSAQDVISRMKNAEKEQVEGDTEEDREARMLLNKFLGAQVLMSGMEPLLGTGSSTQSAVSSSAQLVRKVQKTKTTSTSSQSNKAKDSSKQVSVKQRFQCPITPEVLQDIWDEQTLRALLEQCTDYEERRAIRARLRQVMAEQEAVANVISSAVAERDSSDNRHSVHERFETKKSTFSEGPITTTQEVSTRVINSRQQVTKPMSPFAKFRQLDKQNSLNTPPSSPRTPTGSGAPFFKFTDPALSHSASTVKDRLLFWCQMKTKEYENVKLENFSTSWADGLAFCALIHHFLPNAFDYHALTPQQRRHNFTLAFKVADEQAGIYPLLDVDDMVAMRRPDWKCVFTYVQAIYRRFKDEEI